MLLAFACFAVAGFCVGGAFSLYRQGRRGAGLGVALFAVLAAVAGGLWWSGA